MNAQESNKSGKTKIVDIASPKRKMLDTSGTPANETLMDIAIDTGDNVISRGGEAQPAPIRTTLLDDEANDIEQTESSPSPRSKKSRHRSKKEGKEESSPSPTRHHSIKESSTSPIPGKERDESIHSPDTIRSRKSVDKIEKKEREREREKEKDRDRRKSRSKKDRDEPSFLESTEFKLTMQKLENEGSGAMTVQLVE